MFSKQRLIPTWRCIVSKHKNSIRFRGKDTFWLKHIVYFSNLLDTIVNLIMKKILIFLGLLYGTTVMGQVSIEINEGGYFINGEAITKVLKFKKLKSILGSPNRTFQGINNVHTYDEDGIYCYQPHGSSQVTSVVLDYIQGFYDFSPKETFQGNIRINNINLHRLFSKDSLEIIPNLYFDTEAPVEYGYWAVTFNDVQIMFNFSQKGMLNEVGLSYSEKNGIYEQQSRKYNSSFTLKSLNFNYEKGEIIDGQKKGIWEYYDEPDQLAIKFDHDKNELIYQEKSKDEYVVKNGIIWEPIVLDVYPRNIGTQKEFYSNLSELIKYPSEARTRNISGDVYVSFEIDIDGKIKNSKLLKDLGGGCGNEVINALNSMKKPWIVAMNDGVKLKSIFIICVNFQLKKSGQLNKSKLPSENKIFLPMATRLNNLNIIVNGTPRPMNE